MCCILTAVIAFLVRRNVGDDMSAAARPSRPRRLMYDGMEMSSYQHDDEQAQLLSQASPREPLAPSRSKPGILRRSDDGECKTCGSPSTSSAHAHMFVEYMQECCPCRDCHDELVASMGANPAVASPSSANLAAAANGVPRETESFYDPETGIAELPSVESDARGALLHEPLKPTCFDSWSARVFAYFFPRPSHPTMFYCEVRDGHAFKVFLATATLFSLAIALSGWAFEGRLSCNEPGCGLDDLSLNLTCAAAPLQLSAYIHADNNPRGMQTVCDPLTRILVTLNNTTFSWCVGVMIALAIAFANLPSAETGRAFRDQVRELDWMNVNCTRIIYRVHQAARAHRLRMEEKTRRSAKRLTFAITVGSIALYLLMMGLSLAYAILPNFLGKSGESDGYDLLDYWHRLAKNPGFWVTSVLSLVTLVACIAIELVVLFFHAPLVIGNCVVETSYLTSLLEPITLFGRKGRPPCTTETEVQSRFDEDRQFITHWLQARHFHIKNQVNFELQSLSGVFVSMVLLSLICFIIVIIQLARYDWSIGTLLQPLCLMLTFIAGYAIAVVIMLLLKLMQLLEYNEQQVDILYQYLHHCHTRTYIYRCDAALREQPGVIAKYTEFEQFLTHLRNRLETVEPHIELYGFPVTRGTYHLAASYALTMGITLATAVIPL